MKALPIRVWKNIGWLQGASVQSCKLSTGLLVNHLEGLSLLRISGVSDCPFISFSCLLRCCLIAGLGMSFISMPGKSPKIGGGCPDMTIAVYWDIRQETKYNNI